jgi:hypothetical protein
LGCGRIPSPSAELRYVVYPWVVECAALPAAGWRPAFSNADALSMLLAVGRVITRWRAADRAEGRGEHRRGAGPPRGRPAGQE